MFNHFECVKDNNQNSTAQPGVTCNARDQIKEVRPKMIVQWLKHNRILTSVTLVSVVVSSRQLYCNSMQPNMKIKGNFPLLPITSL